MVITIRPQAKIYDYNGPLADISEFRMMLKRDYNALFEAFYDPERKDAQVHSVVMTLFHEATQKESYQIRLTENAGTRLEMDCSDGFFPIIFTSQDLDLVLRDIRKLGIDRYAPDDWVLTVSGLIDATGLNTETSKDDPQLFSAMLRYVQEHGFDIRSYVDNQMKLARAARVGSNAGGIGIGRVYFFDEKHKGDMAEGVITIDNMLQVI